MLRPNLLEGVVVLVAGGSGGSPAGSAPADPVGDAPVDVVKGAPADLVRGGALGDAVSSSCAALGAVVRRCDAHVSDESAMGEAVKAALGEIGSVDLLVLDGASLFAGGLAAGGQRALRVCMDATWNATRAVANHAFLSVEPAARPGRIVYLAPPPAAGASAGAARAGLENLSRTLSTEWARHGITVLTIAPGDRTTADEVAALCAYLASPAGAYFSGCLLDLRGP